ncbi:uncharacterized protein LOC111031946 [Myzus persicae]|uniref:uncharacterized protein LOC111031946 n=1 Tax=Myzus persicae TaxID=13164 RepID=UPI000B936DF9|nr:uncharacterized protein LOC111031946 [Myzus persicae]XP_022167781.1 uncharacterized protein LOC111031946 [Myzus persicae]
MSIFNWFYKIFNTDVQTNLDLPSEFQLPTEGTENINAEINNLEIDDFTDSFNRRNQFENDRNVFNLEDIFRLMELEFQNFQNNMISDVSTIPINQSTNKEELKNGIPKKNFIAQSTFLNPCSASRPFDKPSINIIKKSGSQYFEKPGWSSRSSYVSKNWNGRIIEKETRTNQLQDGNTETVIIMKDGNKKCVETITENSKTGEKIENLQLFNLDKNELNEFKNQF